MSDDEYCDEDFMQKLLEKRKKVATVSKPVKKETLKQCSDFKKGSEKFPRKPFLIYVKKGSEINERLRNPLMENEYEKEIKNISLNMKTLEEVFPSCDFIVVCRTMSKEYSSEKTSGFMSTSNNVVGMSLRYLYTIIIPKDVKIGMIDISAETGILETYEVIIDKGTQLEALNEHVYGVASEFLYKNFNDFTEIAKNIKKCSTGHGTIE